MKSFLRTIALMTLLCAFDSAMFAQNINRPDIPASGGLSVNSYSGGLFYHRTDLWIPGVGPGLDFTFYYNGAQTALDLGYGNGWTMTYSMKCVPSTKGAAVLQADGRVDLYALHGASYVPSVGIFDSLAEYQPGKFVLRTKHGIEFFFDDSTHHRLTKIADPNGNSTTISYTDSLATLVTDAAGRSVRLVYTSGHLTELIDSNTVPPRHIGYTNDTTGEPLAVADPLGNTTHYAYDMFRNMTELIDKRSAHFTITYSNCVNVQNIASPVNAFTFSYDTTFRQTTVGTSVGGGEKSTVYSFDTVGNVREIEGNCCGYDWNYAYDAARNLIQSTDPNGNVTSMTYDAKGNMLSMTDALHHTTSTTYEPIFNHPLRVISKNGNVTSYRYNPVGNLLETDLPTGIEEINRYNTFGEKIYHADGNGDTTTYAYNTDGDDTLTTFADGSTHRSQFDNVGNPTRITDANGHTTANQYDAMNRLVLTIDPLNDSSHFSHDANGNVTLITNAIGRKTSYRYDSIDRRISETTPVGTTSTQYDEQSDVVSVTDAIGNTTRYGYDLLGRRLFETDPLNNSRTYTYDNAGNDTLQTDFDGNATHFAFDADNRMVRTMSPLAQTTTYTYDADGNTLSTTDANGNVTSDQYDSLDRKTNIARPIGSTTMTYDKNSNIVTQTDANSHTTTSVYNKRNWLSTSTDPLGHIKSYTYDGNGNQLSFTDPNGHTSTASYDAMNRKTVSTNALGESDSTFYNAIGLVTIEKLANGESIQNTYDSAGRILKEADRFGTIKSYAYDANSNVTTVTDGNGNATTSVYDVKNRLLRTTDPLNNSTFYGYDKNSNRTSMEDRNGNTTIYAYDSLNRQVKTTLPVGNSVITNYDANGNIIATTDPVGNVTTYSYDADNRKIAEHYADTTTRTFTYDAKNNILGRTDRMGRTTHYSYDSMDRLIARQYPDGTGDTLSYDNTGNLLTADNPNVRVARAYDNVNRMTMDVSGRDTTRTAYNVPAGTRTLTYPGGKTIQEIYDTRERLDSQKDITNPRVTELLTSYQYDSGGRLATRIAGAFKSTFSYDNDNRAVAVVHWKTDTINPSVTLQYTFDNDGNRKTESLSGFGFIHRSKTFQYDANNRVMNYSGGSSSATAYDYDGAGNRSVVIQSGDTTKFNVNKTNEYTSVKSGGSTTVPLYDKDGNVIKDVNGHTYQYDFENRVTSVDSGQTASYEYDALGRRFEKTVRNGAPAGTFITDFDGSRPIRRHSPLDTLNGDESDQLQCIEGPTLDNDPLYEEGATMFNLLENSMGSIEIAANESGAPVEQYDYDAYGNTEIENATGEPLDGTSIGNIFMFDGMEYDAESGNYYDNARMYSPSTGAFNETDPAGCDCDKSATGNGYVYSGNNPVNVSDPSGLYGWSDFVNDVGSAASAVGDAVSSAASSIANSTAVQTALNLPSAIGETFASGEAQQGLAQAAFGAVNTVASITGNTLPFTAQDVASANQEAYGWKPVDPDVAAAEQDAGTVIVAAEAGAVLGYAAAVAAPIVASGIATAATTTAGAIGVAAVPAVEAVFGADAAAALSAWALPLWVGGDAAVTAGVAGSSAIVANELEEEAEELVPGQLGPWVSPTGRISGPVEPGDEFPPLISTPDPDFHGFDPFPPPEPEDPFIFVPSEDPIPVGVPGTPTAEIPQPVLPNTPTEALDQATKELTEFNIPPLTTPLPDLNFDFLDDLDDLLDQCGGH